ncbi:hypothetical protein [Pontivivens ytuae]|uniref:Uncharacterized protein n=1 Tax=Pontivivens ytuae TaxID=2789856 RepID=A0A7S9LT44_9RHOB|nr:hypothetical protein [Pontivivens ytuae]QPH54794.1 hypothetical protein I0K15_03195 [Pontivivens ytuae]
MSLKAVRQNYSVALFTSGSTSGVAGDPNDPRLIFTHRAGGAGGRYHFDAEVEWL